jgi:plasmid stabilization system protein ParE
MEDAEPTVYAVRPSERAAAQIEAEIERQEKQRGSTDADDWASTLLDAIGSLATYPQRCPIASENKPFQRGSPGETLRVLLFRHKRGATWRILFTIDETSKNDPATVRIQILRHGAQSPMTEWPSEDE